MTWQAHSVEDQRSEFVRLAHSRTIPIRELCRRFVISPKTGYKWLARAEQGGERLAELAAHRIHLVTFKSSSA